MEVRLRVAMPARSPRAERDAGRLAQALCLFILRRQWACLKLAGQYRAQWRVIKPSVLEKIFAFRVLREV